MHCAQRQRPKDGKYGHQLSLFASRTYLGVNNVRIFSAAQRKGLDPNPDMPQMTAIDANARASGRTAQLTCLRSDGNVS
jgi:hypothetical protein